MSRSKLFVDPTDKYLTRKYTLAGNYAWDTPKHRANLKCCACQGGIVQPFFLSSHAYTSRPTIPSDRSTSNDFIIPGFSAGARFWTKDGWTRRKFNGGKFAAPEVADETLIYHRPWKLWRIVGRWRGFFLSMRFWEKIHHVRRKENNNNNKTGLMAKKCVKSYNFSIFIWL